MTNEEAIEILQEEHNYVQEPCYVMNAIKKAIEALQDAEKCDQNATEMRPDCNTPLTLEQLRQMDGKPVWLEDKQMPELSGWGIMRDDVCDGYHGVCFIEEYGKRWIAYAYPPANIDLEAWEPCESCISCDNCRNQKDYDPYEGTYGECGQCYGYAHFDPCNFCHECGKPLTPEARALLEKRLRG